MLARCAALAAAGALALTGCNRSIDLSQVDAERQKAWQRYDVVEALAANEEAVVGASQAGVVVVSSDHGRTWRRKALGPVSIIGLTTCPDGSFVGIDFNHKVWSANRQGESWQSIALDKPRTPLAITCDGHGRWWVAGSGAKIAVSADHGSNWTVTDLQEDAQITTLQFVDAKHGFALAEFGHVIATEDGGATWKKVAQIPGDFYPYAALFQDTKLGWVSGLAGQLLQTSDGGRTWSKAENKSGASLYRLFIHQGQPYGVGAGGVIVRLEQKIWQPVAYPDAVPVFLGAGASLGGHQAAVIIGGPGGLIRAVATDAGGRS
jgi:photosystem II stability/assembly factor-like uncharacterized protein